MRSFLSLTCGLALLTLFRPALGNALTNGSDGINVPDVGLSGDGIGLGQVEQGRPGLPGFDPTSNVHSSVVPAAVFRRDGMANLADVDAHAERVAGIMISTDATLAGVAPDASLYASAYVTTGISPGYEHAILSIQQVATQSNVRAVNHSWGKANSRTDLDGNSLLTLGLDWSASQHNVLHVVAGNEGTMIPIPTDNFNGLTVAYSERVGTVWRQVGAANTFDEDAEGDERTSIALLAPGDGFAMTNLDSMPTMPPHPIGTSYATPHVTGTVALLQELAEDRITNAGAPRWTANARRHEVMKAVLMNSADKLIDDGTVMVDGSAVPMGGLIGMERTVVKQDGASTWLNSIAYDDSVLGAGGFFPLDEQMGAGHLNATRALQQFNSGEYESDSGDVPTLAWDYGHTTGEDDINRYPLEGALLEDHFISITLAWDRQVQFDVDGGTVGEYDVGDTFQESTAMSPNPTNDDLINNLDVFLLPKGSFTLSQAVAQSVSKEGTLQHIFFQIPTTDEYEIWVRQFDADISGGQDYALAWWYGVAPPLIVQGDYDGNGTVGPEDYDAWTASFGNMVAAGTGADGNENGIIDAADYVIWRKNVGTSGSGGQLAVVPEPSAIVLAFTLLGAVQLGCWRRPG